MSQEQAGTGSDVQGASEEERGSLLGALASGAWKLATGGPRRAVGLAQRGFSEAERLALSTLKRRMAAVADEAQASSRQQDGNTPFVPQPRAGAADAPESAAGTLSRLLELSAEQTPEHARELLSLRILHQLVPDEARILAGLADGHAVALVHLGAGPMVGPATQRWLENLSPVGKECGVRLLDEVPHYIRHLRQLELLESANEDKALQLKYQLIEADTKVRATCEEIEKSGLRPKFFRRTLRMSDTGKAFWAACEARDRAGW